MLPEAGAAVVEEVAVSAQKHKCLIAGFADHREEPNLIVSLHLIITPALARLCKYDDAPISHRKAFFGQKLEVFAGPTQFPPTANRWMGRLADLPTLIKQNGSISVVIRDFIGNLRYIQNGHSVFAVTGALTNRQ